MPKFRQDAEPHYSAVNMMVDLFQGIKETKFNHGKENAQKLASSKADRMTQNFKGIQGEYPGQSDVTPVIEGLGVFPTKQLQEVEEIVTHIGKFFPHKTNSGEDTIGAHFNESEGRLQWNYFVDYKKISPESKDLLAGLMSNLVMEKVVNDSSEIMKRDNTRVNIFAQHDLAGGYITDLARSQALESMGLTAEEYVIKISSIHGADQAIKLFRKCLTSGSISPRRAFGIYKQLNRDANY